jgi:hypothetical protein
MLNLHTAPYRDGRSQALDTSTKPAAIPLLEVPERYPGWVEKRDQLYRLARTGFLAPGIPVIKSGGRYFVPVAPLERVLGIGDDSKEVA